MDDNRAIAFPEIEKWIDENYPNEFYGCHRLIVIDAEGDLEGYSKQEFIQKANEGYPQNLSSEK